MRRYSRVREKLSDAVHRLATREGDVRARLKSAHWVLKHLTVEELPPELRDDWESIMRRLTRYGPERYGGEVFRDAVTHTMSRIRNSTGRVIATEFTASIARLSAHMGYDESRMVGDSPTRSTVSAGQV